VDQQWQDTAQSPEPTEGKAPRTAPDAPSRKPLAIAHHQPTRQTTCAVLLNRLPGLACLRKLTLEEGDLLDKSLSAVTSRCQCRSVLYLPRSGQLYLQHKRVCAPLGQMLQNQR
jgi:hypothetical protein